MIATGGKVSKILPIIEKEGASEAFFGKIVLK